MAADLRPDIPGLECFAEEDPKGGKSDKYIFDCKGNRIGETADVPPCTDWIWWDADKLREYPVRNESGFALAKYKGDTVQNGFEGSIMMVGDLFGDWREEIVTVVDGELRVYTTTIPAADRRVTFLQDPLYRSYIYNRSMGYQQSPSPTHNF